MARFNTRSARPAVASPVASTGLRTTTHEGGAGHLREPKSELFLLAVTNMVGQDTFYESGGRRDDRYTQLVRRLAIEDPEWTAGLLGWLRGDGNLRTASLVGAAEFTRARLEAGAHGRSRQVVDSVLQRADEPGELLGYWTSRYGRALPKPIKRGVEDAVGRLYTERALLKYDSVSKGFRFGDVIELCHPKPAAAPAWQGDLFKHAIDRRHGRGEDVPGTLELVRARAELASWPEAQRRELLSRPDAADVLRRAGMTWEALAGWLQGPMDRAAWEAVIPSMGYMALLRNLRNFDDAGVSDEVAARVAARLADPAEVARSRQFPFRFLAAYQHAVSLRWSYPLEQALGHSLANVPSLPGRTLVLVDRSGSMFGRLSERTQLNRADSAAVFGTAVAMRATNADLVEFGTHSRRLQLRRRESVLRALGRFTNLGGTDTTSAVRAHYHGHDRVVIVTDEQAAYSRYGDPTEQIPVDVPVYTWNLAGYRAGHGPSGSADRHVFGGLTDAAFRLIPLLEAGRDATWPWER
jgi:hypothetical protein